MEHCQGPSYAHRTGTVHKQLLSPQLKPTQSRTPTVFTVSFSPLFFSAPSLPPDNSTLISLLLSLSILIL